MQQDSEQYLLHNAAHLVYPNDKIKEALAHHLIRSNSYLTTTLADAAAAVRMPPPQLQQLLQGDPCLRLCVGPAGQQAVALDPAALKARGKRHTTTGVLFGELPPAVGFVDNLHPIRPGRPDCSFFQRTGMCSFAQKCVFNHRPEHSRNPLPCVVPGPGSSGHGGHGGTAHPPAASGSSHAAQPPPPAGQRQQQQYYYPARPGARFCPQFMGTRTCAAGPGCPYDHPNAQQGVGPPQPPPATTPAAAAVPPTPPLAQQQQQQQQQQAVIRYPPGFGGGSAAAASGSSSNGASSSASSSSTQQPDGGGSWAAHAARGPSPAAGRGGPGPSAEAAAPAGADAAALVTRREPGAGSSSGSSSGMGGGSMGPGKGQQQQQQQQGKQGKMPTSNFPSQGVNNEGLPMRKASPSCPFYLGAAYCGFKSGCKYHHPNNALHPECVSRGELPRKWDVKVPPPYARLVNHLQRLWDYDSCVECQLKVWLARHLIAKENPRCGMFDPSAARAAASEAPAPGDARPLGPYSCTLQEAGQVLSLLWKAQPDAAAEGSMPYSNRLRDLLAGDPYIDLRRHEHSGDTWVRLRISRIKELLNF